MTVSSPKSPFTTTSVMNHSVTSFRLIGAAIGLMAVMALPFSGLGGAARAYDLPAPKVPFAVENGGLPAFFDCMRGKTTLISGHRGGVEPGFPENALETMANTLAQAPMILEIDVRTTSDGKLVLMHDRDLERTTTGTGRVSRSTFEEIKALRLREKNGRETGFAPVGLREALAWAKGKTVLQLDVKRGTKLADVIRVVQEEKAQDYAVIIVYSVNGAAAVHRTDPTLMLSVGIEGPGDIAKLAKSGASLDRVVAWTGVGEVRPMFWRVLAEQGHAVAFGALWTIDRQVEETGDTSLYADVTAQGVDILATDHHIDAYKAVQTNGSTPEALKACGAAAE